MCTKVNSCVQKWISMNSLFTNEFTSLFMNSCVQKWIRMNLLFTNEFSFLFMNSLFTHEFTFKHMNSLFYIWIPFFAHEFTFVVLSKKNLTWSPPASHFIHTFKIYISIFTSARTLRSQFLYVCLYVTLIKSLEDEKVNFKIKLIWKKFCFNFHVR